MAKKTYVSPGIMLLQTGGGPGTGGDLPFSQYDPDNPKGNKAKETMFDDEEYDTGWEY